MGQTITYGIAAGVVTALLFGALVTGVPLAMLLYLLTPLPAFAAGLSQGPLAAAVTAIAAALLLLLASVPAIALSYAGIFGLPVWLIVRLAFRTDPTTGAGWGRILGLAVMLAGAFGAANIVMLGPDEATYRQTLKHVFDFYQQQLGGVTGEPLPAAQSALVLDFLVRSLPGLSAISWFGIVLGNLWLALRLPAVQSGPARAPLSMLETPAWMPVTFMVTLALAYLGDGPLALTASAFAAAHGAAYVLDGLALVHRLTRPHPWRGFILTLTYVALIAAGYYVAFALITLALAAPVIWPRPPACRSPCLVQHPNLERRTTMQVVLLERIARLGQMGDVVKVKDGYARNFLLPQGKALRATKDNLVRFEADRSQLEARNLELKVEAEGVHGRLDKQTFIVIRQAGDTGQLYGSVATRDVAEAVTAGGYSIDRRQVRLDKPIKTLGVHQVKLVLHPEVVTTVSLNVARSTDEAERQSRGEDVLSVREAGPEYDQLGKAAEDVFEDGAGPAEEAADGKAETKD